MSVYFTSDLHIGHSNIIKHRDRFKTAREHDEYMLNKIYELNKRDVLFILGDFLFDSKGTYSLVETLKDIQEKAKCRIKLVLGNHDSKLLYTLVNIYCRSIELQLPLFSYKNMWLSHCPIHQQEMRGRSLNVHGHLHLESLNDSNYFNVNIDVNGYEFVKLGTIKDKINE